MLPLPYCLRTARRLWHQDFTERCAELPAQVRKRTLTAPDGTTRDQVYAVPQKVAPTTCKDTGSLLLKMALDAADRARRAPQLAGFSAPTSTASTPPPPPPIFVNAPALGRKRTLADRTLRTHLRQLEKMGFIVARKFHGTRSDIELTINPKYLWKTLPEAVQNAVDSVFSDTRPHAGLGADGTEFPLKALVTQATGESATYECGLVAAAGGTAAALATPSGNTGPQVTPPGAQRRRQRGAEKTSTGAARRRADSTESPALGLQRAFVVGFWGYARQKLYPSTFFSEEQNRKALNTCWAGVFGKFTAQLTEKEWETYHSEALQRVDLVVEWLGRNPDKCIPAPFAEIVAAAFFSQSRRRRYKVRSLTPRARACSWRVPLVCCTAWCKAWAWRLRTLARLGPARGGGGGAASRASAWAMAGPLMLRPSVSSSTRCSTLRNSCRLPGQEWRSSACWAAAHRVYVCPGARRCSKPSASSSTSAPRSRSGGNSSGKALRR